MFRTECIISLHKFGLLVALIRQNPGSQGMIQAMQPASRSVDPPSQFFGLDEKECRGSSIV